MRGGLGLEVCDRFRTGLFFFGAASRSMLGLHGWWVCASVGSLRHQVWCCTGTHFSYLLVIYAHLEDHL